MIINHKKTARQFNHNFHQPFSLRFWQSMSFFLLVLLVLATVLGFFLVKTKLPLLKSKVNSFIIFPLKKQYYQTIVQPSVWELEIGFKELQQLEQKRQQALEDGILITTDEDFVKAKMKVAKEKYDVKIRLKGDWTDHLLGKKWSYRVKVTGDEAIGGMRVFSLQAPETRNFLNEWLFFQAAQELNLIALRYDFVQLVVNGQTVGIMAVEEHFSKELVENNSRREGPILKINEDRFWQNGLRYHFVPDIEEGLLERSPVDVFKANAILADPVLNQEFGRATFLLAGYRNAEIPADQVFDLDAWAKFTALCDVFGVRHGLHAQNLRFYYNPVTGLLEPVPFDLMSEVEISRLAIEENNFLTDYSELKQDRKFLQLYIKYLDQFSKTEYLGRLLNQNQDQITKLSQLLKLDYDYQFKPNLLRSNTEFIRKKLTDHPSVLGFLTNTNHLQLTNLTEIPVEIISLIKADGQTVEDFSQNPIYLPGSDRTKPPKAQEYQLKKFLDQTLVADYQLKYHFLGVDDIQQTSLQPWTLINQTKFLQPTQLPEFITFDKNNNQYSISRGSYQLRSPVVIPAGSVLKFEAGAQLDQINSSYIISYSPVLLTGTSDQGIVITSTDQTGQGLIVTNAQEKSVINYVEFSHLNHPQIEGFNISSSVGFYQSPVLISNSVFKDNSAEDLVNIIHSEFKIENSSFLNSFSDALDVDFGQGEIINTNFKKSGNDSIDVSTSFVNIKDTNIVEAGDKAVSAGERSVVNLENVTSVNSNLGFASKDLSELIVKLSNIEGGKYGFITYQKKPEYGPGTIEIWNTSNTAQQPYLIEENSVVKFNAVLVPAGEKKVYQLLYPDDQNQ